MTLTNIERLAVATGAEPSVTVAGDGVTVAVRTQGAVFQAVAATVSEAARKLLDALGVE